MPFTSRTNRLPSNIPLRTISGPYRTTSTTNTTTRQQGDNDQFEESTSFLGGGHSSAAHGGGGGEETAADEAEGREFVIGSDTPSDEDDEDDEDSWTSGGDIVDQAGTASDSLQIRLNDKLLDDETLAALDHTRHRSVSYQDDAGNEKATRGGKAKKSKKHVRIHPDATYESRRQGNKRTGVVSKEDIKIPEIHIRPRSGLSRVVAAIMPRFGRGFTGKPLIYFTSVFVSLGVFLFGYDQGVMSGILTGPFFRDYFHDPSRGEVGTMVAILEVGAFISSLLVGRIGDIIGRRKTILYGSMIFFVGGALQTFANGMPMMMLGRIIAGLGVGSLSTIVPVYQSEISPPHNRGKLACIEFSGNIIGYTTSVWVDYFCGYIESDTSWRLPLFMQCVMGALLGFGSLVIVESPRWLLDNDHDEEGIVVIANLYGGGDIHDPKARDEFREIKMNVLLQRQEGERTYAEMFRRYRTRVLIAMSAQGLAQLNGINVISYYAPYVFESAGWVGHSAVLMTGINGITYFLSTIPPWYVVDTWGRRPILLSGAVMMCVSLSLISYFLYLELAISRTLVVIFVMIYNASFGFSWGPIPWLYPPEILPLSIRSKGASLSTATNWAFNWLVGEMTPVLQEWIQWRLYLVHAFFCAISFIIVYFIYPETSGVRLEDMNSLFGDATTQMGTPVSRGTPTFRPVDDSDMARASSPVPSLDLRGRPLLNATNSFPGLDIDPPALNVVDGVPQYQSGQAEGGITGWLSRIASRARSPAANTKDSGRYAPLDNGER